MTRAGQIGPLRRLARAALVALAVTVAAPAAAQTNADPALRQQFEQLFQRQLRNPADLDTTFRFAEIATRLGEYEAAIGALERMLYFNPNLPRVKLELGVLYFRLGSNGQARAYLEDAIRGENVPPEVRSRVQEFLVEVNRRDQPNQFSGFFQVGARHQSNANAGPIDPTIRALGFEATLDGRFRRAPDWNAFVLGGFRHIWDFETGRGDALETTLQVYGTAQSRFDELNLALAELTTGPRFALFPEAFPGLSVRPYVIGNRLFLGGSGYLTTGGLGLGLNVPGPAGILFEPSVEHRWRRYQNSTDYPTASQQTGRLWSFAGTATIPMPMGARLVARASHNLNDADFNFFSYRQTTFDLALPIEFQPPFDWAPGRWTFTPIVGWSNTRYDAPNPIVDPLVIRSDREFRIGIGLDMALYDRFGFSVQVLHNRVNSSLPNYRTRNTSIVLGPTIRF